MLLTNTGDELAAAMLSRTDTKLFAAEAVIQALDNFAPGVPGSYHALTPFLTDDNPAVAGRAAPTGA